MSLNKTLVFVHGYLGSALNWGPILFKLQKHPELNGWNFLAVDLLWHGRRVGSEDPGDSTLDTLVADLQDQLAHLSHFYALGHSFGLRPLLRLSLLEPGRIQGLIAEDSSPEISAQGTQDLRKVFGEIPVPFQSRVEAKNYLDQVFGLNTTLSRFLLSNIREKDGLHGWRFQAKPLHHLLQKSLEEPLIKEWSDFPGPLHLIKGSTEKSFVERAKLQSYLEMRPGLTTEVHEIEGAGHWVHSEQPDAFIDCLVKILKSIE